MTNKEAIAILEELPDRIVSMLMPLDIDFDYKEALNLAIKSLKRVDCIYVKDECSFACGECGYCEAEKEGAEE